MSSARFLRYLGHFSRYIRPGACRAVSSTSRDVLEAGLTVCLCGVSLQQLRSYHVISIAPYLMALSYSYLIADVILQVTSWVNPDGSTSLSVRALAFSGSLMVSALNFDPTCVESCGLRVS